MIKIIIATHKKCEMPDKEIYIPIHVGKEGKKSLGYLGDNTGNNISSKNSKYCELTGLYWSWKNLNATYIGLVHYRRYFANKKMFILNKFDRILTQKELEKKLSKGDIIVPKKRKYYIETIYSHYKHTHYAEHLDLCSDVINHLSPEYNKSYEKILKNRSAYMFNMFIMSKDDLDAYCKWLFPILFELEKNVDDSEYSLFQSRYLGRVSEILFNVWLEKNRKKVIESSYIYVGKVNWGRKMVSFILAKLGIKKYEKSF